MVGIFRLLGRSSFLGLFSQIAFVVLSSVVAQQAAWAKPPDVSGVYIGIPVLKRSAPLGKTKNVICPIEAQSQIPLSFSATQSAKSVTALLNLSLLFQGNLTPDGFKATAKKNILILKKVTASSAVGTLSLVKKVSGGGACRYTYSVNLRHSKKFADPEQPSPARGISTCQELDDIDNGLSSSKAQYFLTQDIDCSMTRTWNGGKGFKPIGCSADLRGCPFFGTLEGRGHSIKGLYINRPDEADVGLFEFLLNLAKDQKCPNDLPCASITDLTLEDVDITGGKNVAALVGHLAGGKLSQIKVTGIIRGDRQVGAIVGEMSNKASLSDSSTDARVSGNVQVGGAVGLISAGLISKVSSHGTVEGLGGEGVSGGDLGGLIGISEKIDNYDGTYKMEVDIRDSHSDAQVSSNSFMVGGFIGTNAGRIDNCYATGNVDSKSANGNFQVQTIGGFAGNNGGIIAHSSASGRVSGNSFVGGFVGVQEAGAEIRESFALGSVTADLNAGGFAGAAGGLFSDCYARGDVTAKGREVGGFVGKGEESSRTSSVVNSYSTGNVTGGTTDPKGKTAYHNDVGALAGSAPTVINSFATGSASRGELLGGLAGAKEYGEVSNYFWFSTQALPDTCYTLLVRSDSPFALGSAKFVKSNDGCTRIGNDIGYFYNRNNAPLNQWDFSSIWQEHSGDFPTLRAVARP